MKCLFFLLVFALFLLSGCGGGPPAPVKVGVRGPRDKGPGPVGGPCSYEEREVLVLIERIEGGEVVFRLLPQEDLPEKMLSREYRLPLAQVGEEKASRLREAAQRKEAVPARLYLLKKGACTPFIFELLPEKSN